MVRAISLCRRRSTGSVLQLEIPSYVISEAVDIADSNGCEDGNITQDEEVTIHLMRYIAKNCPNAGNWDIQLEPLFTIVNGGDDLDTIEQKHNYNEDIKEFFDLSEDEDTDELYLGENE